MSVFDWFRGKSKGTPKPQTGSQFIAKLNARMMPVDRGDVFEDPLDAFLRQQKLGEVTGGGTQMAPDPDGILSCHIEVQLAGDDAVITNQVVEILERLGAPKGSALIAAGASQGISLGKLEGLGLFLSGTDLAAETYAASDIDAVISGCTKALADKGVFRGSWRGSRETALYFYGDSYDTMQDALASHAATVPLCERARFVRIA